MARKRILKELTSVALEHRVSSGELQPAAVATLQSSRPVAPRPDYRTGDGEEAIATSKRDRDGGQADGEKRELRGEGQGRKNERGYAHLLEEDRDPAFPIGGPTSPWHPATNTRFGGQRGRTGTPDFGERISRGTKKAKAPSGDTQLGRPAKNSASFPKP